MVSNNIKALAFGLLSTLVVPAHAYWRMGCGGTLVEGRLDSIVTPAKVSGHTHVILGGNGFAPAMDYASTQKSTCTSCSIQGDFSNYWIPKLYYIDKNENFVDVPVSGGTVYYQQRVTSPHSPMIAFPPGFRMTAGNPERRNFTGGNAQHAISHVCLGGNIKEDAPLPNGVCKDGVRAQVYFPSCWDGKNLDSEDHQSHMSYPSGQNYNAGVCPDTHPIPFISIFFEFIFGTGGFEWPDKNNQPFVYSMGDKTGYGLHGDFFNGWDTKILQNGIDHFTTDKAGEAGNVYFGNIFTKPAVSGNQCTLAPLVDEQINGKLTSLPGCNHVAGLQKPQTCSGAAPALGVVTADIYTDVTSKGWQYNGCGHDEYGNNALPTKVLDNDAMTVEACVTACGAAGFSYAGLEYARQCFCGNTLPDRAKPVPGVVGDCNMPCTGNPKEKCGAGSRLSIYQKCSGNCKNADFSLVGAISGGGSTPAAPAPSTASIPSLEASSFAPAPPTTSAPAPSTTSIPSLEGSSFAPLSGMGGSSGGPSTRGGSPPASSPTGGSTSGGSSGGYGMGGMGGMGGSSSSAAAAASPTTSHTMMHPYPPIATATDAPELTTTSTNSPDSPPPTSSSSSSGASLGPSFPANWQSAGCFTDNLNPRSLDGVTFAWWGEPMTSSGCATYCDKRGFKYAGTENGGQCFCGNELKMAQKADAGKCDVKCNGGKGEMCGGGGSLSVFVKGMGKREGVLGA